MGKVLDSYDQLKEYFIGNGIRKLMLVAGKHIEGLKVFSYIHDLENEDFLELVRFSDYTPNPKYEEIVKGVKIYRENNCDAILAIGGGSAIDVAKCIKMFAYKEGMGSDGSFLFTPNIRNDIQLAAVPTTAGTGSEVTKFAVLYFHGEKYSVEHESMIPDVVLIDGSVLASLPDYQKKATMLDAMCHAIESLWSPKCNKESLEYSKLAIKGILGSYKEYLKNETADISDSASDSDVYQKMLYASMNAGKAINITHTTAGHAMSYKLTTKYGIAHGHAVALCVKVLWKWMLEYERFDAVKESFHNLAEAFGVDSPKEALNKYEIMLEEANLSVPLISGDDINILVESVNTERLNNHPIALSKSDIRNLYETLV